MEWYKIVFIFSSLILGIQLLMSFFSTDSDFDVDFDGELTIGDVFSFKGLVHFIFGTSLTLTVFDNTKWITILVAILVGVLFVYGLFYLYKFMYKKLEQNINYETSLENVNAEVYYWDNRFQSGQVFVVLEGRRTLVNIENKDFTNKINLISGQMIKVSGTRDLVHIV